MNISKMKRSLAAAFLSQGFSMLVSIAMSLIVPKVLGIEAYGYWQLFIFYANYAGFFHLGLNDGVYLLNGGKSRDEIDKSAIGSQFRFELVFQLVIGMLITAIAVAAAPGPSRSFVIMAFTIYMVISNLASYLGYVFQAMNETRLYSFSVALDRMVFLVPLLIMVWLRTPDFQPYVIAYIVSKLVAFIWCLYEARDILSAPSMGKYKAVYESALSIRVGFKLMIANVADMLILGVARALVDAVWGIEAFGQVSFSLSLVNFFISFVAQASMVLFPALRQTGTDEQRSVYHGIRDVMEIAFPVVYILYFPIEIILSVWLPQYAESMRWLAVLLPVCVFNTKMDVCCTTYFKVLRKERILLLANIATMAASGLLTILGIFALGSLEAVLVGTVCCIAARSAWSELWLDREMSVDHSPMLISELVLTAIFVVVALSLPEMWALITYCVMFGVYLLLNRSEVASVAARLRKVV